MTSPHFRTLPFAAHRILPWVLVAIGIVVALTAAYHAVDSRYLQDANARRLRAEYAAIATARYAVYANEELEREFVNGLNMAESRPREGAASQCGPGCAPPYTFRVNLVTGASSFSGNAPAAATRSAIVSAVRLDTARVDARLTDPRVMHVQGNLDVPAIVYRTSEDARAGTLSWMGSPCSPSGTCRSSQRSSNRDVFFMCWHCRGSGATTKR